MNTTARAVALLAAAALLGPACNCEGGENIEDAIAKAAAPASLDLGSVALGLSTQGTLSVSNSGTDTLHIRELALEGPQALLFSVQASGLDVIPRAATTLTVSFRPTAEVAASAVLHIRSNAVDNPDLQVTITGVGLPPAITVNPLVLDYGELLPRAEATQMVTLTNGTNQPVNANLYIADDATQAFSVATAGVGGNLVVSVAPLGTATVGVRFAPNHGGRASAILRVDSCGEACGAVVALVGVMAAPRVEVTPIFLDLGRVNSGESAQGSITVANRGSRDLTLTQISVAPDLGVFTLLEAPLVTLAPEATTTLRVQYQATRPGRTDASVSIQSDDPRTPEAKVEITGATSGSDVVILPGALNLGTVAHTNLVQRELLVLNRGDQDAQLLGATLTGDAFAVDGLPAWPVLLTPSAAMLITITFQAVPLGVHNGTFVLTSDSPGRESITVPLEATRVDRACAMEVSSAEINLGAVRVGQQTAGVFQLTNVGTGDCVVSAPVPAPGFASDASFSFVGQGGTVAPGNVTRVTARFLPRAPGAARAVGQVGVAGAPPLLVTVRGRGMVSGLSVNPSFVDFGAVPENCGMATRSITLLSEGSTAVQLQPATTTQGTPFAMAGAIPSLLPPGAAATVPLRFAPTSVGTFTAQVRFMANLPDPVEYVVALSGQGVAQNTPQTEHFNVEAISKMDVLFIIDNSGSMGDDQDNLASNAARFIQVADFRAGTVDYQLGVTTTDVETTGERGRLLGSPAIIRRAGSATSEFTARARVGTSGSGWEQGLEAARLALSPPMVDGANLGFLRDDAGLAIIVVSDEEDSSPLTVEEYVNFFTGLKAGTGAPVVINGITGQTAGCATAYPAQRYEDAVVATGGITASICDSDWGGKLQAVGEAALLARGRFRLSGVPQPGSVQVTLDGRPQPNGWRFDAASNSVVMDPGVTLNPGARVDITYIQGC